MNWWLLNRSPEVRRNLLLGAAFVVPVLFLRFTNDPINVPKLALLIAVVAVLVGLRSAELLQGARFHLDRIPWIPAAGLAAALLVGWLASPFRGWALFGEYGRFQGLLPYLVIVTFGLLVADAFDRESIPRLGLSLLLGGGVVGAYGLAQVFGADPLDWALVDSATSQATSTLGNPNFVGGYLAMVLPLAVWLWVAKPSWRTVVVVSGVLATVGWVVAQSQGGWAAGVAGLSVTFGYLLASRAKRTHVLGLAAAVVIALVVVGSVLVSALDQPNIDESPDTAELRAYGWIASVEMAKGSPIVGDGPNSFALLGVHHRTEKDAVGPTGSFPDDPHSVPLAFLNGAGVLGLAAFLLLVGWVARELARDKSLASGALAGMVTAYLVQSLVSIDEISLRFGLWTAVGAVAATTWRPPVGQEGRTSRKKQAAARRAPLRRPLVVGAVGVVALASVWWSAGLVLADARARWATDDLRSGRVEQGIERFEAAVGFRPDAVYRWRFGQTLGNAAVEAGDPEWLDRARKVLAFTEDLPHLRGLVTLGRLLDDAQGIVPGTAEEAVEVYERAIEIDPLNPLLRVEFADVLNDLGRYDEAQEVLEPARRIGGRRFASIWGALAIARINSGDVEGARDAMLRAFELDPSDPQALAVESALED